MMQELTSGGKRPMMQRQPCGCIVDMEKLTAAPVKLCAQHEAEADKTLETLAADHGAGGTGWLSE